MAHCLARGRRVAAALRPALAGAALMVVAVAGPAGAQIFGSGDDDVAYARDRLETIAAELRLLRQDLGLAPGSGVPPVSGGGGGGAAGGAGGGALDTATLRRLEQIEAEIARLTRQVEELDFRVDRIAEDATRRFGSIEFRLTELEGGDIAALPTNPPPVGGPVGGGTSGAGTSGGGTSGASGSGGAPAVSISEQRALDRAVLFVQQGRLDSAEDGLLGFLDDYPDSPLTPEAQFWLGETYATQGDWQVAARAYLDGYEADPAGALAPDNLVKLGVALSRLGRRDEACATLQEVPSRFPSADRAVDEAEGEARRLACG
ncbi:MAG: tol-pal system protein YbgF [Pseudomonadota bacterium]